MANISVQVPDQLLNLVKQNTGIDVVSQPQVAPGSAIGATSPQEASSEVTDSGDPQAPATPDAGPMDGQDTAGDGGDQSGAQDTGAAGEGDATADPLSAAMDAADAQLGEKLQAQSDAAVEKNGLGGRVWDAAGSAGVGIMAGAIHAGDAFGDLIGRPDMHIPRVGIINDILSADKELGRRSAVNSFIGGTAAFVTAMLGLGKVSEAIPVIKNIGNAPKAIQWAGEVFKGATAGSLVFDPHGARISDLIQKVPALRNPVNAYLSSNPDDSGADGRLKNALEGIGMDVVMAGAFRASLGVYKYAKLAYTHPEDAVAKAKLAEANQALSKAVADAKEQAAQRGEGPLKQPGNIIDQHNFVGPKNQPDLGQVGDKLPDQPNVVVGGQQAKVTQPYKPTRSVISLQQGLEGDNYVRTQPEPKRMPGSNVVQEGLAGKQQAADDAAIAARKLKPTENVITGQKPQEAVPPREDLPNADMTKPETEQSLVSDDAKNLSDAIKQRAKDEGQPVKVGKGSTDMFKEAVQSAGPKIETNGIGYRMMTHQSFTKLGKSLGVDNSKWLAMADRKTGQIWVSRRILEYPPAKQADIIMHETGHSLEAQFVKATTGKDGLITDLPANIKAQMVEASKKFRPETWEAAKTSRQMVGRKTAKQYLNSPEELFADSFAMWKNHKDAFRQAAPDVAKAFDKHFAPWIDFDFTTAASDIAAASDRFAGHAAAPRVPGGNIKSARETDRFTSPRIPTDDEVSTFVRDSMADDKAIEDHGSKQAAEEAGHHFAEANLPYQKLLVPGGLEQFMARTAANFKATLDKMKAGDVLHDSRVEAVIRQRAYLFNEDGAALMGQLQQAGSAANAMVANMEAAFAIANKAGDDLYQLVKELNAGNFTQYGGNEDEAWASLGPRLALYVEALGQGQAMRAAAGRSLRRLRGDFQLDPALINKLRTLDPEAVNRIVVMSGGDRKMMAKMATRGFVDRLVRTLGTIYANNLLWLWPSHVRNFLGNVYMMSTRPAARIVGSFALKEGGQDIRRQAMREYRYMLSGMSDLWELTKSAYLNGDGSLAPHNNEYFRDSEGFASGLNGPIGFKPMTTVGDFMDNTAAALGVAIGQPTRALGAADEFFKQAAYRGTVLARASLEADDKGLIGQDYMNYLKDSLDAAYDADGRGIDREALQEAEVRTFAQPLLEGTLGKSIAQVVSAHPYLRFVLPFVRTPVNLFRYSVKLTPVLNLLQKEYRQMLFGKLGPRQQADAWGQMAQGAMLSTIGVALAMSGVITGGGPSDPGRAKALAQTGWRPYSIRANNGDGSHTYIPFNSLDPIGMQLSFMGDITQMFTQGMNKQADMTTILVGTGIALAKNFANRTYFQSISNLVDAISDPDANVERVTAAMAANAIPFSSLQKEVNTDPYMRDARSIQEQIMAQTPGFSTSVPPVRDVFGEPVLRTSGLVFTDKANDAADAEEQRMLTEYGIGLTPTPSKVRGGIDLRTFTLKSTGHAAFDEFARITQKPDGFKTTLKQAVGDMVLSKKYASMPEGDREVPGTKLWALGRIVDRYRDAAYKQLLKDNKDLSGATALQQQAMREARRAATLKAQAAGAKSDAYISKTLQNANAVFGLQPQQQGQ